MSLLRLGTCVGGVYAMFLLWAIAQERLSVPFPSVISPSSPPARFKSILTLNTTQACFSFLSSFIYLLIRRPSASPSLASTLGLNRPRKEIKELMGSYAKVAMLNTSGAPFGFASLRHISYPTMVLGKSCKLVPVLFMNVILYRRRFPPHKYLVVALVTLGISFFMLFGSEGAPSTKHAGADKKEGGESLLGLGLLVINLLIDGATNSGQDEIFRRFKVTGQQMMFFMSLFTLFISLPLILLPLPAIPHLNPNPSPTSELTQTLLFLRNHPALLQPLLTYAFTGALGQLFIFETLGTFGSLTLVMVTVTRKLVTMMLSVILFDHKLQPGQWFGAGVVFVGIGVEAWAKISDDREKKRKLLSATNGTKGIDAKRDLPNGSASNGNGHANGNGNGKVKAH